MEVYDSLTEAMGNTPLLRLKSVTKGVARTGNVLAKIEYLNPGGSVKDRIALRMVETAERQGKLGPGGVMEETRKAAVRANAILSDVQESLWLMRPFWKIPARSD